MNFLVKYSLEGEGTLLIQADDRAAAEKLFDATSLEELVDNADFTGGVDVLEIAEARNEASGDNGTSDRD